MFAVKVTITRYVRDDQPGFVECQLQDIHGWRWVFIEKIPVVSEEALGADDSYPRPGMIACEVVNRLWRSHREEVVLIDTERPWGVWSVDGKTRFSVRSDSLVELP